MKSRALREGQIRYLSIGDLACLGEKPGKAFLPPSRSVWVDGFDFIKLTSFEGKQRVEEHQLASGLLWAVI